MNSLNEDGKLLFEYAKQADFSAQQSVVKVLFPYIYMAAKRMSLRAIHKWLIAERNIKISVVALARAMNNKEKHWRELCESVEPSARIFADAHQVSITDVLDNLDLFNNLETKPPMLADENRNQISDEYEAYLNATATLRSSWFDYPVEVRNECRRHLAFLEVESAKRKEVRNAKRKYNRKPPAR